MSSTLKTVKQFCLYTIVIFTTITWAQHVNANEQNWARARKVYEIDLHYGIRDMTFGSNSDRMIVLLQDPSRGRWVAELWSIQNPKKILTFKGITDEVCSIEYLDKFDMLVIAHGNNGTITCFSTSTGEVLYNKHLGSRINCIDATLSQEFFLCGSSSGELVIYNTQDLDNTTTVDCTDRKIQSIAVSPNSNYVAMGTDKGQIKLFELESNHTIHDIGVKGRVEDLLFSKSGKTIYAYCSNTKNHKDSAIYFVDPVLGGYRTKTDGGNSYSFLYDGQIQLSSDNSFLFATARYVHGDGKHVILRYPLMDKEHNRDGQAELCSGTYFLLNSDDSVLVSAMGTKLVFFEPYDNRKYIP